MATVTCRHCGRTLESTTTGGPDDPYLDYGYYVSVFGK